MFKNLEDAILLILETQKRLENKLDAILQITWSRKDVARYLKKSTKTVDNYIKNGKLQEGKHFVKENGRLLFYPEAVIDFKKDLIKPKKINKVEKQLHPISKKILHKIN
ncbi:DNA-binding protein [Hydrogenimonas thermophila]|uniref:Helix-turn-helix domain-containing protein n=1 Tax=Hydrogenimonas thermophila TaxID=223786 RepID=A0A1I5UW07_9BACT|nr:DNA-binding protein [Hydrogenimonas thermophila]SFP99217.1 hypothetical protein SAMN05216234_1727 [Hydrogenimonas thermophila]